MLMFQPKMELNQAFGSEGTERNFTKEAPRDSDKGNIWVILVRVD